MSDDTDRIVIDGRELALNPCDLEDGDVVLDAFLMYRVQKPDQKYPSIHYTQSEGMPDEVQIGVQIIVLDRCRAAVRKNWIEDD